MSTRLTMPQPGTARSAVAGTVEHIFVAPRKGAPMAAQVYAEAIQGSGLEGDRYAEAIHRRSQDETQVTLIQAEHVDAFNRDTGLELKPDGPRRNIVTRGVPLNDLVGKTFRVGDALLEGVDLCEPCGLFAKRTFPQVKKAFAGKGGLRARIVEGGGIRVGDSIRVVD